MTYSGVLDESLRDDYAAASPGPSLAHEIKLLRTYLRRAITDGDLKTICTLVDAVAKATRVQCQNVDTDAELEAERTLAAEHVLRTHRGETQPAAEGAG